MNTDQDILSTARAIARKINAAVECGMGGNGKLVFGLDGSGGAWYSDNCYGFGDDCIVIGVPHGRMSTARVLDMLESQACNALDCEVLS